MITNVLFKKEQKGLVAGYLPNGKEVYVDVYKNPNVAIIDDDESRLKSTFSKFGNELLKVSGFSIVSFWSGLMIEQTPEYREESIDNAPAYFSELRQEVTRRYELFSQFNVKNIDEYNLKQGNALKRIVVFLDAQSIDRIIYKSDFREIGLLCVAAGIFFCYYSQSEKINRDLYIYEEANYIEFDRIRNTVLQDSLFCEVVDFATEEKAINAKMLGKRFSLAKNQATYYMAVLEKLGFIGDETCYRVLLNQRSKNKAIEKARTFVD